MPQVEKKALRKKIAILAFAIVSIKCNENTQQVYSYIVKKITCTHGNEVFHFNFGAVVCMFCILWMEKEEEETQNSS